MRVVAVVVCVVRGDFFFLIIITIFCFFFFFTYIRPHIIRIIRRTFAAVWNAYFSFKLVFFPYDFHFFALLSSRPFRRLR